MTKGVKQGIVFFSNSDYTRETGGTEKFLSEIVERLLLKGYFVVQVYPLRRLNRIAKRIVKSKNIEFVSINLNECYYGTFELCKLEKVLNSISYKYSVAFQGVIINQMNYFEKQTLGTQLNRLNLPIRYIVHDFTSVCPYVFWSSKSGTACDKKIVIPCETNCGNCNYLDKAIKNYKSSADFFCDIRSNLDMFICPSMNTLENLKRVFDIHVRCTVRPHLIYGWKHCEIKNKAKKLRIAYMGQPANHKGFAEWNRLVNAAPKEQYEFYYLGNSNIYHKDDDVKTIRVDYREKTSKTMQEQLADLNIDIVFQWSKCQETYSYTYFEATSAGCFVITNPNSGNIAAMTLFNKNGIVFEDIDKCIEWIKSGQYRKDVDEYQRTGKKIIDMRMNPDISDFVFDERNLSKENKNNVFKNPVLYIVGKFIYFQH